MEVFWLIVLLAAACVFSFIGWERLRQRDGRVPRKPKYVELPDDDEAS